MKRRNRTLFLVETAIFSTLALILDIVPFLSFKIWANGGSVSFAMIPVLLMAFRWGIKGGVLSGLLLGFLQLVSGTAYILHPTQAFLDYVVAFGVIGLAGIFYPAIKSALANDKKGAFITYIVLGTFVGSGLRFLAHYVGGIVFFAEYAPEGQPVWLYSLIYNGTYMLPAFILSAVVVSLVFGSQPRLVTRDEVVK